MKRRAIGALVLVGLLAACGGRTQVEPATSVAAQEPEPAPTPVRGTLQDALSYMASGDGVRARAILTGILEDEPDDRTARNLLAQIDTDPRTLLGAQNYSYRIRPGDTLSTIARDRLGDSSMFFALARYNGIEDPRRIVAGQTILIPGTPIAEPEPVTPAPRTRPQPQQAESGPARNPARARALRAQGLAAMNRGDITRAVSLLSQASRLDPGNGAVRADLARARRIREALTH